jgi:hypothetical protein
VLPARGTDSVEVVAGIQYKAGGFHRWLFGTAYRDRWTTPVMIPVLDLQTYAGGLRPQKVGGGNQTRTLRMVASGGGEYVFRNVAKSGVAIPAAYKGSVVETLGKDQGSASDPAAAVVTAPILQAAGVLHVTPVLVVMPDDPALGEFRAEFAGKLGMIEQYPSVPKHGPGFAGAIEIIDSDSLLARIDRDPTERVDAVALLAARLVDMMLNDWDRHPGQWKWARMHNGSPTIWEPIARDRDKDFISYEGAIPTLSRLASPNIVAYDSAYPSVRGLTWNSLEFDRRLLGGLGKPVWDSVAAALVGRITDSVIDAAVRGVPPEYLPSAPTLAGTIRARRDGLPGAADRFYLFLALFVDIHATDADDRAVVTRVDDRFVDIEVSSAGTTYYRRRFDAAETREIRLYLHGADDSAVVTGHVRQSIPIRVIGGDGTNLLMDSSLVDGSAHPAHLYDEGTVHGIDYGPDTLFDRRPWIDDFGKYVPPGPDHGGRTRPVAGLDIGDLGVMLGAGLNKIRFGFDKYPYASQVGFDAEYAAGVNGFRVGIATDLRRESSPLHFTTSARMSQLEVTNYHGLGNATAGDSGDYYAVREQQWSFLPAAVLDVGRRSALSLGPVIQYTVSDSAADRFVTVTQPYGYGQFGQAGLRLGLSHDIRDQVDYPRKGYFAAITGSVFPALWDVKSAFGDIAAAGAGYLTLPIPAHPTLALRGSARKVFGTFPFQESAFIGGDNSVRTLEPERYAGDASLAGTAELRVPVATFAFVLPLSVGVFGFMDAGRVWADGASPDGWHSAAGGGFWLGFLDPSTSLSVTFTNGTGSSRVLIRGGFSF